MIKYKTNNEKNLIDMAEKSLDIFYEEIYKELLKIDQVYITQDIINDIIKESNSFKDNSKKHIKKIINNDINKVVSVTVPTTHYEISRFLCNTFAERLNMVLNTLYSFNKGNLGHKYDNESLGIHGTYSITDGINKWRNELISEIYNTTNFLENVIKSRVRKYIRSNFNYKKLDNTGPYTFNNNIFIDRLLN